MDKLALIPLPQKIEINIGVLCLKKNITIRISSEFEKFRYRIVSELKRSGLKVTNEKNVTALLINYLPDIHPEGYILDIDREQISIKSSKSAGLIYGLITLNKILHDTEESDGFSLPCCRIDDYPRFKWRGLHLDVSRHFFPVAFMKKYLDLMTIHKLNRFHWHLTDDNGWRIEIKKHPLLTEISAWREDLEHLPWNKRDEHQSEGKGKYGGFYTQAEIREIIDYAGERNIEVIPEIELPGHSREVFAAYPEYSCSGKKLTVAPGGYWPNQDIFCAGRDNTFSFLQDILDEICDLFPSPYIHIGGDEADKHNWKSCPDCQNRIRSENLKNEKELQSYFISRIGGYLRSKGKKFIGWDEISEGGLDKNAVVMCWRGNGRDAATTALANINQVIMTPNSILYFDWKQTEKENEQGAFGVTSLQKVYDYDPAPAGIKNPLYNLILGAQANVWTEYMPDPETVEYMLYPRVFALSESTWSNTSSKDYLNFVKRLITYRKFMKKMNINFKIHELE